VKAVLGVLHAAKSKLVAVSVVTFITFLVLLSRFKEMFSYNQINTFHNHHLLIY
jgi:hypothetical protein